MRPPRAYRSAFTLVELLTVAGIIALLIGILVPSLQSARAQARRTSSMSTVRSLESALEAFHNDFKQYPDSSSGTTVNERKDPITNLPDGHGGTLTQQRLYGAHWLARALTGHDLSGVDSGQLVLQDGSIVANQLPYDDSRLKGNRKGPYLEKTDLCVRDTDTRFLQTGGPATGRPIVVDAFNFPILYYQAHPKAQKAFSETPQDSGVTVGGAPGVGVYNHEDNVGITGCNEAGGPAGWQLVSGGATHPLKNFGTLRYDQANANVTDNSFVDYLDDDGIRASTATPTNLTGTVKAIKPESFILISPGKDGLYGTDDDVNNFKGK